MDNNTVSERLRNEMESIITAALVMPCEIMPSKDMETLEEMISHISNYLVLWDVISTSTKPEVRQAAAILFRNKIDKKDIWLNIYLDQRTKIKSGILERILIEPEKSVKNEIIHIAGVVAQTEGWPELFALISNSLMSADSSNDKKELGMFTLVGLLDVAIDLFVDHIAELMAIFEKTLCECQNLGGHLACLTLNAMSNVVCNYEDKNDVMIATYRKLFSLAIETLKLQPTRGSDRCIICCTFFSNVITYHEEIMDDSNVVELLKVISQLAVAPGVDDDVRNKLMDTLFAIVDCDYKVIVKSDLTNDLIKLIFHVLSIPVSDGTQDIYRIFYDDSTFVEYASVIMNTFASLVKPKFYMNYVMEIVNSTLEENDLNKIKAVFLMLGAVVESCKDWIESHSIIHIMQIFSKGLQSTQPIIRNGTIFALYRFASAYDAEIATYSRYFFPNLIDLISELAQPSTTIEELLRERILIILETCCENEDEESIVPFMVPLYERLMNLIESPTCSSRLRQYAIDVMAEAANINKEFTRSNVPQITEALKPYILQPYSVDHIEVQVAAFGCIASFFELVTDTGSQLVADTVNLSLKLVSEYNESDTRKILYVVLKSAADVKNCEIVMNFLPTILPYIRNSLTIDTHNSEQIINDENGSISDSDDDEEDDYHDSSIVEEKENVLNLLAAIAKNLDHKWEEFYSVINSVGTDIFALSNHEKEDIRIAAVNIMVEFCLFIYRAQSIPRSELNTSLRYVIPQCLKLVLEDEEEEVVTEVLECLSNLIDKMKDISEELYANGYFHQIANCIQLAISMKTNCQKSYLEVIKKHKRNIGGKGEDDENDVRKIMNVEELPAEEQIFQSAGDIIIMMSKSMKPEYFGQYYPDFVRTLIPHLGKKNPKERRISALAVMSECMVGIQFTQNTDLIDTLLSMLLKLLNEKNSTIRNNSVYCIGELARHTTKSLYKYYPQIIGTLMALLEKEKVDFVLDNTCAAVARIICTNPIILPLPELLPMYMNRLPLREDFDENVWVYRSLNILCKSGIPNFPEYIPKILIDIASELGKPQIVNEAKEEANLVIQSIQQNYPSEFDAVQQRITS